MPGIPVRLSACDRKELMASSLFARLRRQTIGRSAAAALASVLAATGLRAEVTRVSFTNAAMHYDASPSLRELPPRVIHSASTPVHEREENARVRPMRAAGRLDS